MGVAFRLILYVGICLVFIGVFGRSVVYYPLAVFYGFFVEHEVNLFAVYFLSQAAFEIIALAIKYDILLVVFSSGFTFLVVNLVIFTKVDN